VHIDTKQQQQKRYKQLDLIYGKSLKSTTVRPSGLLVILPVSNTGKKVYPLMSSIDKLLNCRRYRTPAPSKGGTYTLTNKSSLNSWKPFNVTTKKRNMKRAKGYYRKVQDNLNKKAHTRSCKRSIDNNIVNYELIPNEYSNIAYQAESTELTKSNNHSSKQISDKILNKNSINTSIERETEQCESIEEMHRFFVTSYQKAKIMLKQLKE